MDARTAANYIVYLMGETFDDLTNMKINKLLYFAQGHYLSKHGRPLFDDRIEAWEHGPVIPSVYSAYKKYGDTPIRDYNADLLSHVTPESEEILYGVAWKYGENSASSLRRMTHTAGSPWEQVYRPDHAHTEIPLPLIESYFAGMGDVQPAMRQFEEKDFIGYRNKDGILVLPKEWDDGEI